MYEIHPRVTTVRQLMSSLLEAEVGAGALGDRWIQAGTGVRLRKAARLVAGKETDV